MVGSRKYRECTDSPSEPSYLDLGLYRLVLELNDPVRELNHPALELNDPVRELNYPAPELNYLDLELELFRGRIV